MYNYCFRLFLISLLPFGLPVTNPSIDASSIQPLPTLKPLPNNIQPKSVQPKLPFILKPPYEDTSFCAKAECSHYGSCLSCSFPEQCDYGDLVMVNCTTIHKFCKKLEQTVVKEAICRYCYQTEDTEHECDTVRNCSSSSVQLFPTTCRVQQSTICIESTVKIFTRIICNNEKYYQTQKFMTSPMNWLNPKNIHATHFSEAPFS